MNLKYGMRKQLRKACTRFLKFSYLLDFYALEALSKIYLHSVKDTIARLSELASMRVNYELKTEVIDDFADLGKGEKPKEKKEPMPEPQSMMHQQLPFFATNAHF